MIAALRSLTCYEWYIVVMLPVVLLLVMWWMDRWEVRLPSRHSGNDHRTDRRNRRAEVACMTDEKRYKRYKIWKCRVDAAGRIRQSTDAFPPPVGDGYTLIHEHDLQSLLEDLLQLTPEEHAEMGGWYD